jgi:hypothetical protein
MLVTNGITTRNIAPNQLAEYQRRGYKPVVQEKPVAKAEKGAGK